MRIWNRSLPGQVGAVLLLTLVLVATFFLTLAHLQTGGPPQITHQIAFTKSNSDVEKYLGQGWHAPESWGVWSKNATVTISIPLSAPSLDIIRVGVVYRRYSPKQSVRWSVKNSISKPSVLVAAAGQPERVEFLVEQDAVNRALVIELQATTDPILSPQSLGHGNDDRPLGVGVDNAEISWSPSYIIQH